MPRREPLRNRKPRDFVAVREEWPESALVDGAPEVVGVARLVAQRVKVELGGRSVVEFGAEVGLHHRQLYELLRGERIPSVATIVQLERALGVDLWPRLDER